MHMILVMVAQKRLRKFVALGGYALLGPITGPLTAGVVRNLRGGAPILAGLYGVAIAASWLALGCMEARMITVLAHHG